MGSVIQFRVTTFNSPLEAGVRAVCILAEAYPRALDLGMLVNLDYLTVHTGDLGGPASLHAPVPLRSGEILVRRGLIESGLALMMSRGLIERTLQNGGVFYGATDLAWPFVANLMTPYNRQLQERAAWAVAEFADVAPGELTHRLSRLFDAWMPEFQSMQSPTGA